ncbi:hypothetical protein IQ07DRAFT_626316 [Pyrenochaeta sp. DS3sAY3a]|nr:hypothetical protein IQ07DRAFT_626316 [Pyrenochaeta sp. DS3sAY3a]
MPREARELETRNPVRNLPKLTPICVKRPGKPCHKNATAKTNPERSPKHTKCPPILSSWWSWARQRLTLLLMLLFNFSALTIAIGHGLLFMYLDGLTTDGRNIKQSYVTNISLLFVTAFKECIVAAVGLSFTQHLWSVLRHQTLPVGRIEQLFSIRSNPVQLTKFRLIINAPMLFLMGIFVWLVPIAAIYPPSALTVTSRPYNLTGDADVPILYPPSPSVGGKTDRFPAPRLSRIGWSYDPFERKVYSRYYKATDALLGIARTTLLSGEIAQIQTPDRENASYTLEFPGYRVACISNVTNITKDAFYGHDGGSGIIPFDAHWSSVDASFNDSDPTFVMRYFDRLEVTIEGAMQTNGSDGSIVEVTSGRNIWDLNPFEIWNPNVTYKGQYHITTCRPLAELFVVDVSYERSKRQIKYTTRDYQGPKPNYYPEYAPDESELEFWKGSSNKTISFPPALEQILQNWEKWGILDASLGALEYSCRLNSFSAERSKNGALTWETYGCGGAKWNRSRSYQVLLDLSTFNTQRFNEIASEEYEPMNYTINEQTINEYIANVTISAMSLNLGKAKVPINYTEYRTTYHFSRPVNLIVPYSLLFLFSTISVVFGILSLNRNGAAATDGGFLQIMTTNVGRTKAEDLITEHYISHNGDNVPDVLLDLKIRYGELIDESGVGKGIAGFGTEEETRMLKKGQSLK